MRPCTAGVGQGGGDALVEARALWLGHMARGGGRYLQPVSAHGPVVPRVAAAAAGAAPILSVMWWWLGPRAVVAAAAC